MKLYSSDEAVVSPEAAGQVEGFNPFEAPDINDVAFRKFGAERESKLKVVNPDPDKEYRWVVNNTHNMKDKYDLGYRLVPEGTQAITDFEGGTPRLNSGRESDGSGQLLILVWRPMKFRERQNELLRSEVALTQKQLDPRHAAGVGVGDSSDAGSFTGSVEITGGSGG